MRSAPQKNSTPYKDTIVETVGPVLIVILAVTAGSMMIHASDGEKDAPAEIETKPIQTASPFDSLDIEAKSALVYDAGLNHTLYSANADTQLPLASITKVMTAYVAHKLTGADTSVEFGGRTYTIGTTTHIVPPELWNLKTLSDFTLVESSNEGARAIASAAASVLNGDVSFVDVMNSTAQDLGMQQTYFLNPSGLDEEDVISGSYGSARDVAKLFEHIVETSPDLLEATRYSELTISNTTISRNAYNTNEIVDTISGILASKTGFTDLAGGNLAVAFDAGLNHPIILVVLGSTQEGRFSDIEKLYRATLEHLELKASQSVH